MGWIEETLKSGAKLTAAMLYERFGFSHVIGIHIYGRQAIAGPICIAAVTLDPDHDFVLKPANKLTLKECYVLSDYIRANAPQVNLGWVDSYSIRALGLEEAMMGGIRAALYDVSNYNPPSLIFIDGFTMPVYPNGVRDSQTPVIVTKKGVEQVDCITAASIINRVSRNDFMKLLAAEYPDYDWVNNGGFATTQHIQLIKQYGITPQHRDLSKVKLLSDFRAFANERWRKKYEDSYFGT